MSTRSAFRIIDGSVEFSDDVVELFRLTAEHNGHVYPPAVRIQQEGSLDRWVWLTEGALRWDALSEDGDLVGSCQLHPLDDEDEGEELWCSLAESVSKVAGENIGVDSLAVVERLVVHPRWRGQGCGRALLRVVVAHASSVNRVAVLDVLATQREALALYLSEGGEVISERAGRSGKTIYRLWFPQTRSRVHEHDISGV